MKNLTKVFRIPWKSQTGVLTSPAVECSRMSKCAVTSTFPAKALTWTPFGASMLRERVGDSSLKWQGNALSSYYAEQYIIWTQDGHKILSNSYMEIGRKLHLGLQESHFWRRKRIKLPHVTGYECEDESPMQCHPQTDTFSLYLIVVEEL